MSNVTLAQQINKSLEQCKHYDKDFRYTGALDCCNAIVNSQSQLDEALETRICAAFVAHLTDASLEVKSHAVKCIQRVTSKIRDSNLITILEKLASEVSTGTMETIDIYSLSIRGIIQDSPEERASNIINTVYPHLLKGIETSKEPLRRENCLEICTDLFKCYGHIILRQPGNVNKDVLMRAINTQLTEGSTENVRKKASYCMGAFSLILTSKQLQTLVTLLVNKIKTGNNKKDKVIQVQCLSLMAKTIGNKLSSFLNDIIPLLSALMGNFTDTKQSENDENELCEACLSTMYSIIHKCPGDLKNYVDQILITAIKLTDYDPNFCYNDVDDDMQAGNDDAGWGSDFEEDDNQNAEQDDDDTSWKVRRGAYRVIDAIVETRKDLHVQIITKFGGILALKFRERVDDVKCDLLEAFKVLVQTHNEGTAAEDEKRQSIVGISEKIVTNLVKQSKNKKIKVKIQILQTLAALADTLQEKLDPHFDQILPVILDTVKETQSNEPFLDSLRTLRSLFKSSPLGSNSSFLNYAPKIQEILLAALNHNYSKVVGTGLSVTGSFLNTLLAANSEFVMKYKPLVGPLHQAVLQKLNKTDLDQEVKQLCIISAADLVSCCHLVISPAEIDQIVKIFINRLSHELTRETALKGLTLIALHETSDQRSRINQTHLISGMALMRGRSKDESMSMMNATMGLTRQKSLGGVQVVALIGLAAYLPQLFELLNKSQRQLQLNALECLEALTRRYAAQFTANVNDIQNAISAMISESDLQKATLALRIATNLVKAAPQAAKHVKVVKAASLATSSELIQGQCLDQLQEFFRICAENKVVNQTEVDALLQLVSLKSQQSALCLAILVKNDPTHFSFKQKFIQLANDPLPAKQIVGTLCLGEYGKLEDLSKENSILTLIQGYFNSSDEGVRQAASIGLGKITIGNPQFYLPNVLSLVTKADARQKYLFLNTLREIILNDSNCLFNHTQPIITLLMSQANHEEESIRSIVAESLGRLFTTYPEEMMSSIDKGFKTNDVKTKATIAKSVKYSGQKAKEEDHQDWYHELARLLINLRSEADPEIKKNALEGLKTIAHNNWQVMKDLLANLQVFAFAETPIRKELIVSVEVGPFTQNYDHGIPIRRAAFELLQTLFEVGATGPEDIVKLVDAIIQNGLIDTSEDVAVLTLQLLAKVSHKAAVHVVTKLDSLQPVLDKRLQANIALLKNAAAQERAQNIIRNILRVIFELEYSQELQESPVPTFSDYIKNQVMTNASARDLYEKIKESSSRQL